MTKIHMLKNINLKVKIYIYHQQLALVYFFFIRMYLMSRKEEFSEDDLNEFEVK